MKNKILILLVVLFVALLAAWPTVGAPNLTNFSDHVHIQAAGGTATPALRVNQNGSGKIVEFSDGGTPVWSLSNGGSVTNSGAQTFTGLLNANGGIAVDTSAFAVADSSGNTVISGTLGVTGATTLVGALGANGGLTVDGAAFSVADTSGDTAINGTLVVTGGTDFNGAMNIDANVDADSISVAGNADLTTINNSGGDLAINDNVDITGTLQYGANDLYPIGYASANQQMVCGTTVAFTATTFIEPTGLTTTTYPIAIQITQPAATAAYLTVTAPTTAAFTLQSWGSDYNAGTTPVTVHWCAVGDQ